MLLKVESYHNETVDLASTLYPCLATSKEDGVLVTAGRKAGDLTFPHDRSVSRQHFVLRCLGTAKGQTEPRDAKEEDACSTNDLKMCVVFENRGKAGSFLCSAAPGASQAKDQDYTDDSETDDEGISQQHSSSNRNTVTTADLADLIPPVSATARKHFVNTPAVTLNRVDVGGNVILPLKTASDCVVIQLGRFQSTIKISFVEMRIMFSNMMDRTFEQTILPKLHTIGGVRVEETGNPTHLVTKEFNSGGKQIIAWAQELPMVSTNYLEALLGRKSCADPMPDPRSYPIGHNSDESIQHWTTNPDRTLLKDFALLSVESGTFEVMATAVGANCVKLHELAASDEEQVDIAKKELASGKIIFIAKTRKRVTKKIAALGVPQVDLKRLAKFVCNQVEHLQDTNGNMLSIDFKTKRAESFQVGSTLSTSASTSSLRTRRRTTDGGQTHQSNTNMDVDDQEESPSMSTPYETQCLLDATQHRYQMEESPLTASHHGQKASETPMEEKLKRVPEQSTETEPSMLTEPAEAEAEAISEKESQRSERNKKRALRRNDVNDDYRLAKADSNGWFRAAPRNDTVRQQWKDEFAKRHREDEHLDFNVEVETAPLVVAVESNAENNWRIPPGRRRKGVKDFRKFRKNRIVKHTGRTIRLKVASLHQQTDDQVAFDEQQQELAEEQRLADALFKGGGFGGGGGRKRRRRVA